MFFLKYIHAKLKTATALFFSRMAKLDQINGRSFYLNTAEGIKSQVLDTSVSISLGLSHVHCRMCLHLLLLCFIDESRKPKLMMPRSSRPRPHPHPHPHQRPCGVARSTVELPCCSRCCRRQMAKIYSKLRRSCIL